MKKRALFLTSLVLVSLLAACASDTGSTATTTAASGSGDSTDAVTEEAFVKPDIPEGVRYDGYEFKVLTSDEEGTIRASFEIEAEQENGDIMNDAVYKRNLMIQEDLGVTIRQLKGSYDGSAYIAEFKRDVQAGDNSYDVLVADQTGILMNSASYGLEVSELPYVDLSKPWWDELVIQNTAIGGKTFALTGSLNLVDDGAVWAVMFNKKFAENHGIDVDTLYQLVRDGKWTLDKFEEYCVGVSSDINGDGVRDMYDEWGNVTSSTAMLTMIYSLGGSFCYLDQDGIPVITVDAEKNVTIMNRLYEFLNSGDFCITPVDTNNDFSLQRSVFLDGRALFINGTISYIPLYLRDMEDDFGVLPNPKWDENQKDYIATAQEWGASMWMVPRSAVDPERTSIILEMMSCYSEQTIVPAYYDKLLADKTTRDEQSVEMLDIIFSSRTVYNLAVAYNWGQIRTVGDWFEKSSNTFASGIEKIRNSIEKEAEKTYDAVMEAAED